MTMVHVAAVPQEKEQRCVRCCRKLIDIDPVTEATFPVLAFVMQKANGECEMQGTDAEEGQLRCRKQGSHGKAAV